MDTEKLVEGKLIDINEESSCNEKDKDVPEEVTPEKNLHIKDTFGDIVQH